MASLMLYLSYKKTLSSLEFKKMHLKNPRGLTAVTSQTKFRVHPQKAKLLNLINLTVLFKRSHSKINNFMRVGGDIFQVSSNSLSISQSHTNNYKL